MHDLTDEKLMSLIIVKRGGKGAIAASVPELFPLSIRISKTFYVPAIGVS